MKLLRQREFMAIPMVIVMVGILFVLFAAFEAGLWAWLLVGAVGIVVCTLLVASYARRHRHPATWDAPRTHFAGSGSVHRVLVIADDACSPEALQAAIAKHAEGRATEAFVVAPAVGSRVSRWTGDEGDYEAASEHLQATLRALEQIGVEAHGRIGSKDPIQAADDGLRQFAADEIVLAVHSGEGARWLEQDVISAARGRYDVPVTPIVLDGP
jgi:hypothetical protein